MKINLPTLNVVVMKNIVFLLFLSITVMCNSQNLTITGQHGIGGTQDDFMSLTKSINNDGYFAIGTSASNISGDKTENSRGENDLWILKLDNDFDVMWDKTIGGSGMDELGAVYFDDNNIYLLASSNSPISGEKTISSFGGNDLWLLCLDYSGNIIWQTLYGGDSQDHASEMIEFTDTSLLITANTLSGVSGNKTTANIGGFDMWLLEISKLSGEIIQQKTIGSNGSDVNYYLAKNPFTNHLFLGAESSQGISGDKTDVGYGSDDLWLVELDQNLEVVNDKCFGGTDLERGMTGIVFEENRFYVACESYSGSDGNKTAPSYNFNSTFSDTWLLKLDYDFNIIWDKSFGGNKNDHASSLMLNTNGNIVLAVSSSSNPGTGNKTATNFINDQTTDLWLLILNSDGDILVQESYGSLLSDGGYVIPGNNPDQDLIWVSYSNGPNNGNKTVSTWGGYDLWIVELDASDFLSVSTMDAANQGVKVYPNPFSNEVHFKFENLEESVMISFYSIEGRLLEKVKIDGKLNQSYTWKYNGSDSIILYSIGGESTHYTGKLVR